MDIIRPVEDIFGSMKELIKLNSRYGENNTLKLLKKPNGEESKTYLLKTSDQMIRSGMTGGRKFIDPSGGPMIVEGERLEEADAVVKSIVHIMGKGYSVTFE